MPKATFAAVFKLHSVSDCQTKKDPVFAASSLHSSLAFVMLVGDAASRTGTLRSETCYWNMLFFEDLKIRKACCSFRPHMACFQTSH